MNKKQSFIVCLLAALLIALLDQLSKYFASTLLEYNHAVSIFPWLNMTLVHNSGAAFSFLANMSGWQVWFLSAMSAIAVIALLIWLINIQAQDKLTRISIILILGGALGNLYDRISLHYVIDFISVHYNNLYYFPTFNLADSAISIGVAIFLLDILMQSKRAKK